MNSLREFFHKDAVVEADKGIYTLEEKQPGQKQKYKNDQPCVVLNLDNKKIKWFLKESSTMCDYAILKWKLRGKSLKITPVCIELKSKRPHVKKAREQLEAGELLCKYLIEIFKTKSNDCVEIEASSKHYILYKHFNVRSRPIKPLGSKCNAIPYSEEPRLISKL